MPLLETGTEHPGPVWFKNMTVLGTERLGPIWFKNMTVLGTTHGLLRVETVVARGILELWSFVLELGHPSKWVAGVLAGALHWEGFLKGAPVEMLGVVLDVAGKMDSSLVCFEVVVELYGDACAASGCSFLGVEASCAEDDPVKRSFLGAVHPRLDARSDTMLHVADSLRYFSLELFSGVKLAGRFCKDCKCLAFLSPQCSGWGRFWFRTLSPAVTALSFQLGLLCLVKSGLPELQSLGQTIAAVSPTPGTNSSASAVSPTPGTNSSASAVSPTPGTNSSASAVSPTPGTNSSASAAAGFCGVFFLGVLPVLVLPVLVLPVLGARACACRQAEELAVAWEQMLDMVKSKTDNHWFWNLCWPGAWNDWQSEWLKKHYWPGEWNDWWSEWFESLYWPGEGKYW